MRAKKGAGLIAPPANCAGVSDYPLRQRPRFLLLQHEEAAQQSLQDEPHPLEQLLPQPLLQGTCFCTVCGTMRVQVTCSWYGTQWQTVRVA
jgi:hypothetical protein